MTDKNTKRRRPKIATLEELEAAAIKQGEDKRAAEAAANADLEAKYPMRALNGGDLFTILGILSKLGIKDDVVQMYSKNVEAGAAIQKARLLSDHKDKKPTKADATAKALTELEARKNNELEGAVIIGTLVQRILSNISLIKIELNNFLGSLYSLTGEEIEAVPLADYFYLVQKVVKSEDFNSVFKSASSFLG